MLGIVLSCIYSMEYAMKTEQNTIPDHSVQIIFEAKKPSKSDKRVGVVGFD